MLIDSHCHLTFPDFKEDCNQVIIRARESGVKLMVTISTKITQATEIIALADSYDDIVCSIGIHPHEVENEPEINVEDLIKLLKHPKVVGVGETGLDYFYEHSCRETQKRSFRNHIIASRRTRLPVIIHTRDADEDTKFILEEEYSKGEYPGLIHCFTAGEDLARTVLDMGFYISISGIATFKNASDLREVIKMIPLERLLVETDSPFLAPVPFRGKRNEPSFVRHTAEMLAEIKDVSVEDVIKVTGDNFFSLFQKAQNFRPMILRD